ncbi:MFS transporter [Rhodococcus sp. O3]|uniref:MFS transporter n=1 Tax=Rhodococcus sp. O3 TaxID=3404919 RepID=UPI003B67E513
MTAPRVDVRTNTALGFGEKASYFAGNLGNIILSTVIGSFLLIYLTDVIGIAAAAVGSLFLVARIVDGASDPIMGYLVDHLPATKHGRFRSYLLIGGALATVSFAALFLAPAWLSASVVAVWVTYLLWGIAFDFMDIPLNSLLPVMSGDPSTRGRLASIKGATYLFGTALITAVTLPVVDALGGGAAGWQTYVIAIAIISFVLTALAARGVRERIRPVSTEKYRFADLRRMFLGNRAVPILLVSKVATSSASAAMMAGLPFFFSYYVGDRSLLSAAAIAMVVPMALGSIAAPALSRWTGSKPAYLTSISVVIVGLSSVALLPDLPGAAYLVCFAVTGFGFGGAVAVNYALLAELTDFVEWKSGFRSEGALASLASFAAKAGAGVGGAAIAYALAVTGYVANESQDSAARNGILLAQSMIPALLATLGGLIFLAYPITRKVAAIAIAEVGRRRIEYASADPDRIDDPENTR